MVSVLYRKWKDGMICLRHLCHHMFSVLPQFGEDHSQTRYSKEFLSNITKQAVKVERSLRQAGADSTDQTVQVPWLPELMLPLVPLQSLYLRKC